MRQRVSFYRDRLGFEITFQGPAPDDIYFGIVRRGGAQILLKHVGVTPVPNYTRDVKKGIARWDAFTSNDPPWEVSDTLAPTGSSLLSCRDPNQTSPTRQANNASAIMISDAFRDVFMYVKD